MSERCWQLKETILHQNFFFFFLYKRRFIHSIQRNTAWFDFDEHPQFLDILVENIEICIVSLLIYTITFYNVLVSPLDLSLCLCLFLFVFIISLLLVFIPLKNKSDWFYCFVVSIITLRVFSWRKLVWGKQIITCQIYQVSDDWRHFDHQWCKVNTTYYSVQEYFSYY